MSDTKAKFKIEMKDLRNVVNYVRNGLGTSKTDLSVMLFRVTVNPNHITLFASDKEIHIGGQAPVTEVDGKTGSFAMLGNKLEKLISQVDSEFVTFTVDAENIEAKAGYLTVNFEVYQDESLAHLESTARKEIAELLADPAKFAALPRSALQEGFVCAKACSTTNNINPALTHAELRNGRLLSSDGRKIMILTHDAFPKDRVFKAQAVALNSMATALKNLDVESVNVAEAGSYFYITTTDGKHFIGNRKIERVFPAIEGQITAAEAPTDKIAVDKLVFENMIKGVSLGLSSEDVKVTVDIAGEGAEAYLELSSVNTVGRRSHERASCSRTSKETLSFPVSFQHLLSTLGVFEGDSVVDLLVMQARSILMVRDTTQSREVMTIIPFRTQAAVDAEKKEAAKAKEEKEAADKEKAKAKQAELEKAQNKEVLTSVVEAGSEVEEAQATN